MTTQPKATDAETRPAPGVHNAAPARFTDHDPTTAPTGSAPALLATQRKLGFVPSAVARMATSPLALKTFLQVSADFEKSSLSALQREVVIMTVALRTGCDVCVVMHSRALARLGESDLASRLVAGERLYDRSLDALRSFTEAMMTSAGDVSDEQFSGFCEQGFTPEQALDVVVGIAAYTLSTYANRLTQAPVDSELTVP